ncbi:uncharacterized protein LOC110022852 [Phalaenopsis equestris]|uniref:uncharacterized protein LOC110022852 n=1 Tax=Phalaenopsis equestris TaxID=78828 RepID=UPI0009E19CBB|nr:uncharacterized protein LOC110022852 [Phalaenopsis equestris]
MTAALTIAQLPPPPPLPPQIQTTRKPRLRFLVPGVRAGKQSSVISTTTTSTSLATSARPVTVTGRPAASSVTSPSAPAAGETLFRLAEKLSAELIEDLLIKTHSLKNRGGARRRRVQCCQACCVDFCFRKGEGRREGRGVGGGWLGMRF